MDEGDEGLIDGSSFVGGERRSGPKPVGVLAVVGRPNVGKSTLVNRILGRRAAVVEDTPGVTRDRVSYDAEWAGTDFKLVDTGGWEADVEGIESAIASQAQIAVQLADAVVLVWMAGWSYQHRRAHCQDAARLRQAGHAGGEQG